MNSVIYKNKIDHLSVDIVIPLYNEAKILANTVETLVNFLRISNFPYSYQITLVNNASTDNSATIGAELAQRFTQVKILNLTEKGKGLAIRRAWALSKADILVFMDADLASDLHYFKKLIDSIALEGNDLSLGNRLGRNSNIIDRRWYREIMSRVYNIFIRTLLHTGIADHQCGFKALSREAFVQISPHLKEGAFFIDTELIVWARAKGMKIKPVDIIWIDRRDSKVNIKRTILQFIRAAFALKKRVKLSQTSHSGIPHFLSPILLAAVMILSGVLMFSVSLQESVVVDEVPYIASGYSYLKYLDYRLDPEHPPLLKMAGAIPLLFMDLKFPNDIPAWQTQTNGQWEVGRQFLFEQGNDADLILRWARTGPIAITLILIFFIYLWGVSLVGRWWALLPATLFGLSPTILSHGHYVTTDVGTACGIFISVFFFFRAYKDPSLKNLIIAGITFGIAELCKFSALLLIPYFIAMVVICVLNGIYRESKHNPSYTFKDIRLECLRRAKHLGAVFLVGFVLIYAVYSIVTINYSPERQKADTRAILGTFKNCTTLETPKCKLARNIVDINVWAADKPIIRPYAEYALGVVMTVRRTVGGGSSYFLGDLSLEGWWYYFPLTYAMKEPLPVLALLVFTAGLALYQILRFRRKNGFGDYLTDHREEFGMLFFVLLYMFVSMRSPLDIGLRYIIPVIPFLYLLITVGFRNWKMVSVFGKRVKIMMIIVIFVWFGAEVVRAYPYYLSYFNQTIGTQNGWKYVVDSNYDWGQDLKRLNAFMQEHHISKIAVNCFSCGKTQYYLGMDAIDWSSEKGNPSKIGIQWFAVSVHILQDAKGNLIRGMTRKPEDEYSWLEHPYEPYARAGTSLFIYKLF